MPHFKLASSAETYAALYVLRPGNMDTLFEIMYTRFNHSVEVVLTESETSEEVNGTWTGVVGALIKGQADVSMHAQIYDAQIAEVVDGQYITYVETMGILTREKTSESVGDIMGVLYDTEVKVWFLMSLVMFTIMMFNKVAAILISKAEEKRNSSHDNNLLTLFGLMLYYGSSRGPRHISTRILLQFYTFSTMIFVCYLYANMKTNVTIIRPNFYKTIEDLLEDNHVILRLINARSITAVFENSPKEEYRQFWKRVNTFPGKIVDDVVELVVNTHQRQNVAHQLQKMTHAYVGEITSMNLFTKSMCPYFNKDVVLVLSHLKGLLHFMLYKKNLDWEKVFHLKKICRLLVETGAIIPWIEDLRGEIPECAKKSGQSREVEMETLMLRSLSNAAMFWAFGLLASGVCFAGEIVFKKFRKCCRFCQ